MSRAPKGSRNCGIFLVLREQEVLAFEADPVPCTEQADTLLFRVIVTSCILLQSSRRLVVLYFSFRRVVAMPRYILTYFDVPGRGQITRYLFAVSGIEFEDRRVDRGEEWLAIKPSAPLNQVPFLEVEGKGAVCQSLSIERYVASLVSGSPDLYNAMYFLCCLPWHFPAEYCTCTV